MGLRSVRILIGALGFLVLSGLCRPTPAWAQCGHYVVRGAALPETAASEVAERMVAPGGQSHGTSQEPARPPLPCSGPNCSRGEPISPPLHSMSPPVPEDWAWDILSCSLPDDSGLERFSNFRSPQPVRHARVIFHPPRPF